MALGAQGGGTAQEQEGQGEQELEEEQEEPGVGGRQERGEGGGGRVQQGGQSTALLTRLLPSLASPREAATSSPPSKEKKERLSTPSRLVRGPWGPSTGPHSDIDRPRNLRQNRNRAGD